MDLLTRDVDVRKEVVPHKTVVAFGMLLRNPDVLVHIESDDFFKGHLPFLMKADEFPVSPQGRGTGGQPQYAGSFLGDLIDRKSTRLNSSHVRISYAVF